MRFFWWALYPSTSSATVTTAADLCTGPAPRISANRAKAAALLSLPLARKTCRPPCQTYQASEPLRYHGQPVFRMMCAPIRARRTDQDALPQLAEQSHCRSKPQPGDVAPGRGVEAFHRGLGCRALCPADITPLPFTSSPRTDVPGP